MKVSAPLLTATFLACAAALAGCGTVAVPVNQAATVAQAEKAGIDSADREALDRGDIKAIRDRYGAAPAGSLTMEQLSLLCDVLLKYSEVGPATACLGEYERRAAGGEGGRDKAIIAQMLAGKRALLALATGKPAQAQQAILNIHDSEAISAAQNRLLEGHDHGALYVLGLADVRLGDRAHAQAIADKLARQLDMAPVFFAASLYGALGEPDKALALLGDPERHALLQNYGLSTGTNFFGAATGPAPFRLAIFDEFSFGWIGRNSLAPAANLYVEYLAARCYFDLGQDEKAKAHYDAILAFPYIEAYRDIHWRALFERAKLALKAGDTAQARALLEKSVAVIEAVRGSLADQEGRISFVADKQDVYTAVESLLIRQGDVEIALEYAERSKARALVDLLFARRLGASAEAALQVEALSRAEAEAGAAGSPEALRIGLGAMQTAREQIRARAPDLAPLVTVTPMKAADIKALVGADEAAVEFVEAGPALRVFVIQRGRISENELGGADLRADVNRFQTALSRATPDALPIAEELYRRLLAQALSGVTAKWLTIIPSGSLYHLAFAALHDGQHYLVERYALRTLPGLSLLALPHPAAGGVGGLVVGNNDSDGPAPLHAAEDEARQIAGLSPGSKLLLGPDATLDAVSRNAGGHHFLHFAGHGEWDPDEPLQSSLVFASVGGRPQPLTAAELFTMKLNVDLAVLSGCATGRVAVRTGDDVLGLLRGFLYAGPPTVIASLWAVDDKSTAELMMAYYAGYFSGLTPVEALRAAQLHAIAGGNRSTAGWAAFFVTSIEPAK